MLHRQFLIEMSKKDKYLELCLDNQLELIKNYDNKPSQYIIDLSFIISCGFGYIELTEYLLTLKPNIHYWNEFSFRAASAHGHLDIIRLLYKYDNSINISACQEDAFTTACNLGNLNIVKQLYEWNQNIDLSAKGNYSLKVASSRGYLEIVKQLLEWCPTIDVEDAYKGAKTNKHIEIIKLLEPYYKSSINVEINNNNLMCNICYDIPVDIHITKCNHSYCLQCIETWFMKNKICPYCRQSVKI
jgi:hypothetical protein